MPQLTSHFPDSFRDFMVPVAGSLEGPRDILWLHLFMTQAPNVILLFCGFTWCFFFHVLSNCSTNVLTYFLPIPFHVRGSSSLTLRGCFPGCSPSIRHLWYCAASQVDGTYTWWPLQYSAGLFVGGLGCYSTCYTQPRAKGLKWFKNQNSHFYRLFYL